MRYARFAPAICVLAAVAMTVAFYATSAAAETIVVTRDDDPTMDGCQTNGCTFREAIVAGNVAGTATIDLGSHQVTLSQGALTISAAHLTIEGDGPAQAGVSGGGTVVIHVAAPANVTASGFKVSGGNDSSGCGGGILNDGTLDLQNTELSANNSVGKGAGVCNSGTLTIENSTISGNHGQGDPTGGGIYNSGTLTLEHSTISNNTATGSGGGGDGAGIANAGTATIEHTTIEGNSSTSPDCDECSSGAGIKNLAAGTLTVNYSTIRNNTADSGAGMENVGSATVSRSTFSGNQANAIQNGQGGHLTLTYSTVSNNMGSPYPDNGVGGVANYGTIMLTNDTIADNTAMQFQYGGLFTNSTGSSQYKATIFSNNGQKNCSSGGSQSSSGYNLYSDSGSCTTVGSDQSGADPMLGSLQDNGGPTFTRVPISGSPAIDMGGPSCPGVEQRGALHVGACDVGSTEFGGVPPTPTPTPSPTPAPIAFPMGDATCSDDVTADDLGEVLKLTEGLVQPSQCGRTTIPCFNFDAACYPVWDDTNCDQQVTGADGLPILYYLIGQTQTIQGCTKVGEYPTIG